MKYWFASILAFFVMAGVGCAVFSRPSTAPVPSPVSPTEVVSGLVGIVDAINPTAQTFSLVLPDQSTEEVGFGEGMDLSGLKSGILVRVDGVRDRSTRLVKPTALSVEQKAGIKVTSPTVNATVTSPLVAFGFAKSETGTIHWLVRASNGDVRAGAEGDAAVAAVVPGGYGTFRLEAFLPTMKDLTFSLELSLRDKNGAETQSVSIPLFLLSSSTTTFNVYFSNAKQGSGRDCSLVFPVLRTVASTSAVTRAALIELLKGPTADEKSTGYFTFFPGGISLRSLSINDTTATADFSPSLASISASCQLAAIRAEIAQTLVQFPSISTITVTAGGQKVPALQP